MLPKKYAGDYTLENTLGADGRVRTVGVYTGPWFRFRADREAVSRAKRALCVAAAFCAAAVLVPLLVVSPILRQWYVMMPLVLSTIPAARLVFCAAVLLRKERFTRRERDRTVSALTPWGAALVVLPALSLIGQIVFVLRGGAYGLAETGVTISSIALAAAAYRVMSLRPAFATEEIPAE